MWKSQTRWFSCYWRWRLQHQCCLACWILFGKKLQHQSRWMPQNDRWWLEKLICLNQFWVWYCLQDICWVYWFCDDWYLVIQEVLSFYQAHGKISIPHCSWMRSSDPSNLHIYWGINRWKEQNIKRSRCITDRNHHKKSPEQQKLRGRTGAWRIDWIHSRNQHSYQGNQ